MAKIVVVGAGIAGVAAAFRLKAAGHQPTVLERSAVAGGRMATVVEKGFVFDVGAGLLPSSYVHALALARDAGVQHLLEKVAGKVAVPRGATTHYLSLNNLALSLATTSLIGMASKMSLIRLARRRMALGARLTAETSASLAGYDADLLADYAAATITREAYDYIVEPTMRALYLQRGDQAAAVHFFWCLANLVATGTYSIKGGMDRLAREIATGLDVRYGKNVVAISRLATGCQVEMDGPDGRATEVFDGCVIALDGPGLRAVYDPGLTQGQQAYLANRRYSRSVNLHFGLSRAPASTAVLFQIARPEDADLAALVLDHLKGTGRAPPGKGMVSAFFMNEWSARMFDRPDEEVVREAAGHISKFVPEIADTIEVAHVQRWTRAATMSAPGVYAMLADFVGDIDAESRVQFCGDYLSESSVNECVKQGEQAARRLIGALGARPPQARAA